MSQPELNRSKYRLLGLVGQGQFGRVYCAIHRKTGQIVALKALERSRFPTRQFLRELRFLTSLQHPHIVAFQALEHVDDRRYLVMDYCEGGTLRSLMEYRLHPALSVKLVADVLSGLDHAHNNGVIHCDIKPENILLSLQPMGWSARISDFGIARLSQELEQNSNGLTGSPAYMAPERFYGQYSRSTDLYAIGILLFELLVGHRPFSGVPSELMSAHLNQSVQIPDCVPAPLQSLLLKSLQKLQARRFHSAAEMLSALKSVLQSCPELKINPRSPNFSLLASTSVLLAHPLQSLREEIVRYPIERLAVIESSPISGYDRYLSRSSRALTVTQLERGSQIWGRDYPKGLLSIGRQRGQEGLLTQLIEPIRELLIRPQGCFVVTARSITLLPSLKPLIQTDQPLVADIEAQGRWIAVSSETQSLKIGRLPDFRVTDPPIACSANLFKLIVLDSRHLVAISRVSAGTHLEFFNRRSQTIGQVSLPVHLDHVILGRSSYQLAAIEPNHPRSLLLINLKPLSLLRIPLKIKPKFLAAIAEGYSLIDEQGQLVLIDHSGHGLSRITGLTNPCAIASFGESGLLVATWHQRQGKLHTLNLKAFLD
ncbi:serine/threonine-protein kinase [Phormidesmis sp. 146-35]